MIIFIKYIIETHSEYLIRNFQQQIASLKEFEEFNTITINYFEKQIEKNLLENSIESLVNDNNETKFPDYERKNLNQEC